LRASSVSLALRCDLAGLRRFAEANGARRASLFVMQRSTKRFWIGCEWGLIATLAMTLVMLLVYFVGPSGMPDPMPLAITTGLIARVAGLELVTPWVVVLGILIQLGYGALWGGLLAVSSPDVTIGKGIAVSLGLWGLMLIFYLPMAGGTAFSLVANPMMWILTLIFHLIYGAVLGGGLHRYHEPLSEGEAV
jgi:hypothetical protein